jgi:hypothetical protein
MPGEFGPLVQPGWPDLKGGPDLAKNFLTGFQQGAMVNYRSRQLENQLANYALQAKEHELTDALREKQFGLAQQRLGIYAEAANNRADAERARVESARDRLDLQRDVFNLASTKYSDRLEGLGGITSVESQLAEEGLVPGTKEYLRRSLEAGQQYAGKLGSSNWNAWQKKLYDNSNTAANSQLQYWKAEKKNFDDDLSRQAFGGKLETDLSKIQDWQSLPDAPSVTSFGWDWRHAKLPTVTTKTPEGVKMVKGTDGVDRPVAVSTLKQLNERYQKLQSDFDSIAPQVHRPDINVFPKGGSLDDLARQAINDPNASSAHKAAARQRLGLPTDGSQDGSVAGP